LKNRATASKFQGTEVFLHKSLVLKRVFIKKLIFIN